MLNWDRLVFLCVVGAIDEVLDASDPTTGSADEVADEVGGLYHAGLFGCSCLKATPRILEGRRPNWISPVLSLTRVDDVDISARSALTPWVGRRTR